MFAVVLCLIPFAFLGYMCYRAFHVKRKTTVTPQPKPVDKVILHGHNLAKWNYLGHTLCRYVDKDGEITGEHPIFLFVDKNNEKRRSYFVVSEYADKNHQYIQVTVKPWAAGEGELWHLISGTGNKPSDYLREYMLEKFKCEWDTDTKWWGTSDKAKYNSANEKQKRERKPKEVKTESNVVTVEFGK